jgi:uncharacterized integral membrane protein
VEPLLVPVEPRRKRLRRKGRRAGLYAGAGIVVVLLAVLIALSAANTKRVEVDWVFGSTRQTLVGILFVTAVVGWLLGIITAALFKRRTRRRS